MKIIEQLPATFKIDVTVVSPLLQIEPTSSNDKDKLTKASMVRTKKRRYVNENGTISEEPFFSANGFRGILRRNIASDIFADLEKKDGAKANLDTIHLYASGGGANNGGIASLTYAEKAAFRERNPFISLFGAGLSDIDGKLSVCDLVPVDKDKRIVDTFLGIRFDESERHSILTPLLDTESVDAYKKELEIKRATDKKLRKLEEEIKALNKELKNNEEAELLTKIADLEASYAQMQEEKGMKYQQTYRAEFISPGTKMTSSIATRGGHEMTELETSMMLHGLLKMSSQNIGSYSRIGWGALNWHVMDDMGNTLFKATCDEQYILSRNIEVSDAGKKLLKPFGDWLKGLTREKIATAA